MSKQFFSSLSKNFIEILKDDEYYDITIEVGEDPNVKIFRAHMIVLCYRSPFLRRILAFNKKNDNGVLAHIKLSNISPEIFQIILKYIYGGIISLNEQEPSETLKILVAADELHLQELVDYLQKYLIENKVEWMEQHFGLVYQTGIQHNSLLELQNFCTNYMTKLPHKKVEVWDHVLKWGLEKNPTLLPDPTTWSDDDFKIMENTLQHYLPLIRSFSLSSDEFMQKLHPYKKLLKHQLYEELLNSYLNSSSEPNDNILLPRYRNIDGIIDSNIVNLNIIALISRWIDKIDINSKFSYTREFYLPYKF
ncbi:BTB/POZ protein [Rhizophagus irregularis DAOM 181602=DAOM 197198]|nr:BTB/POZ protein [Rhizophagus irregularis DAOM 181602=DAOM 197198]